ncbi:MAG: hypothetical protein LAO30_09490 [Acidobacteriia bacterium]|nr:hypothetical protein [Terriglobia bacterium]
MKAEYVEGPQATKNFEEGMKAVFKVPKKDKAQAKKRTPRAPSARKTKRSDKD